MSCWLDDSGRQLPWQSMGRSPTGRRFALMHLGMAEFHVQNGRVKVRWNVARVAFGALSGIAKLIDGCDPRTDVTLEYFWGAWATETGLTPEQALERLFETVAFADVSPFLGTSVAARDVASVRQEGGLIAQTFEQWDRKESIWRDKTANPENRHVGMRILGFQHDIADETLLISHVGKASSAAIVFGVDWADQAVGRPPTRSQPDYEFDERVCDAYDEVMESGDIRVDHVLAYIRRPERDPLWVPYRRLLMRSRDTRGTPTLLSMVEMRPDIDIPFMAA